YSLGHMLPFAADIEVWERVTANEAVRRAIRYVPGNDQWDQRKHREIYTRLRRAYLRVRPALTAWAKRNPFERGEHRRRFRPVDPEIVREDFTARELAARASALPMLSRQSKRRQRMEETRREFEQHRRTGILPFPPGLLHRLRSRIARRPPKG